MIKKGRPMNKKIQEIILQMLDEDDSATYTSIGKALGMSKQLVKYHATKVIHRGVKKSVDKEK